MLGMYLRTRLPEKHLGDDSRHVIEVGLGIVGTMAGLVLGLLVASATTYYTAQRQELQDVSSRVILLDRVLAHYGPEAEPARRALRAGVQATINRIWPTNGSAAQMNPLAVNPDTFFDEVAGLTPKNDQQRTLKGNAVSLALSLAQVRWLMYEQTGSSVSVPELILMIAWFTITFTGFGLFAPSNGVVRTALALGALAISGAIFVTLEMYTPFSGIIQISSEPLQQALVNLGR
jgi:hypothetical protein